MLQPTKFRVLAIPHMLLQVLASKPDCLNGRSVLSGLEEDKTLKVSYIKNIIKGKDLKVWLVPTYFFLVRYGRIYL